jgi:hypothetical protein
MPSPNILDISAITGKTAVFEITNIVTPVLTNPSSSSVVYKLNTLFISNINGSATAQITVDFYRNSQSYRIASTIDVEADTTLVVLGKDTSIYLEPGDALRVAGSDNGFLTGVLSYEILE